MNPSAASILGKSRLTYFDIQGRAEPIRLFLADLDVEWEHQAPEPGWPQMKAKGLEEGWLPFGQIPLFETAGGFRLVQMNAILRYLGKISGRCGKSAEEEARINELLDGVEDWRNQYGKLIYQDRLEPEALEQYTRDVTTAGQRSGGQLQMWESIIKRSGGNFLVSFAAEPTAVDVCLFNLLDCHQRIIPHVMDGYPFLQAWFQRIENRPHIKKYFSQNYPFRKNVNGNGLGN